MKSGQARVPLSISLVLFTLAILVFFFTALNGYVLNLLSGYRANVWLVTLGVIVEFAGVILPARSRVIIERDPLELAGFLITVIGVWLYFVAASLPTLLPPTQSEDAVRVYQQVLFTYPEGKLVSWYPAGGTFFVAMLAHWLGWEPLRVLHPTASSFVALSAGAVYGITCTLLRRPLLSSPLLRGRIRWGSILALAAPALLFVPWSYFAGLIDWEQYFFAQAFAQLFTLAALWFTMGYTSQPNALYALLVGIALVGTVIAYPIFVALPFGLFALVVVARIIRGGDRRTLGVLGILIAVLLLGALTLDRAGILELQTAQISSIRDVGVGGVANPSLDSFGGAIFLLLAVLGGPIAWRTNSRGKILIALLAIWVAQYLLLIVLQPVLKISGYRVDKTFYILVFPLAILATLALVRALVFLRLRLSLRPGGLVLLWLGTVTTLFIGIVLFRPPKVFSPFSESELQLAEWAKKNLDTLQISYLDPMTIRAYWLAFGIWGETLPNEWFQWVPEGTKLGPSSFDEWLDDPAWPAFLLVRDANAVPRTSAHIVQQIGPSAIVAKPASVVVTAAPSRLSRWHYGSTFNLIGYDLPREKLAPGDTLTFTSVAESIYPPAATVRWRAALLDKREQVVSQMERDPFENKYPLQRWPPGKIARDDWSLPVAADTAPGVYELRLGLFFRESGEWQSAWPILAEGLGKPVYTVPLARIKIPPAAPPLYELRAASPLGAHVGENFILPSYVLGVDRAAQRVHVTLYWQSISKTQNDYTVFVHLLDASGKVIAQVDREPLDGNYPTSVWEPPEIIKDQYELTIPSDVQLPLTVEWGMYAQPSLKRLLIGNSDKIILQVAP